jgi:hypothetical protein
MFRSGLHGTEEAMPRPKLDGLLFLSLPVLLLTFMTATVSRAGDPGAGDSAAPVLIRVHTDDLQVLRRFQKTPLAPVRALDGYALLWGGPGSLREIRAAGLGADALGSRRPGMLYAVLYQTTPAFDPSAFGRVLAEGPHTTVLEYAPARANALSESCEIVPIPDRPILWPREHSAPPATPAARAQGASGRAGGIEPDATVLRYVSSVERDSLRETIKALQDFRSRRTAEPGAVAAQSYLESRFRSYGLTDVSLFDFGLGSNDVVAIQPGESSPGEIYVICGHYDSTSRGGAAPGADDNASGISAVMEAARLFARDQFEATITYIAFSGEEQGLLGSEAWARFASDQDEDIRGAINLDMIGWRGGAGNLRVISNLISQNLRDVTMESAATYLPEFKVADGSLGQGNSDQQSFWDAGYPALFLHEEEGNPFYHSSGDLLGTSVNDLDYLRANVQTAIAALATLARPVRVRIVHVPLADPPREADGYTVTARITSRAPLLMDSVRVRYLRDGVEAAPLVMRAVSDSGDFAAVIPRQKSGTLVEYAIFARDAEGRGSAQPPDAPAVMNRFVVGRSLVFSDGFEQDRGWTVGAPGDAATTGIWVRAVPNPDELQPNGDAEPDTSDFCYITGNTPEGGDPSSFDVDGGRTTLTSPAWDLTADSSIELEYSRWFRDQTFVDDTLRVLLSNDDGGTWLPLEEVTRPESTWVTVRFENLERVLSPTSAMRLRFVADDAGRPSLVKVALDAIHLKAVGPSPPLPLFSGASRLLQIRPNPSRGAFHIAFDLAGPGQGRILVYNLLGRRVAEVPVGAGLPRREVVWSGRDRNGRPLSSGVYFLQLEDDRGRGSTERILIVR